MPPTVGLYKTSSHNSQESCFSADYPISTASPVSTGTYYESVSEHKAGLTQADSDAGVTFTGASLECSPLSETEAEATAAIAVIDNDRFRALISEYKRVINRDVEASRPASPCRLSVEDSALRATQAVPDGLAKPFIAARAHPEPNRRLPLLDDSGNSSPKHGPRRQTKSTKGSRHRKVGNGRGEGRVRKKSASVKSLDAYEFLRLAGVRQVGHGKVEYEVVWAPTWLAVEDLQGKDAIREAQELVVDIFGAGV